MAYRHRKPYIPITRSGSSIIASLLTQAIDEGRRERHARIDAEVARGDMPAFLGFIFKHWFICYLWIALVLLFLTT